MRRTIFHMLCLIAISMVCAVGCLPQVTLNAPTNTPTYVSPTIQFTDSPEPSATHQPTETPMPSPTAEPILQLTFVAKQPSGLNGVFAMNLDCPEQFPPCIGDMKLLFEIPQRIDSISWSPDGQRLAISAIGYDERSDIFVANWDGTDLTNITSSFYVEDWPIWTHEGDHLIYYHLLDGVANILSFKPDGSNINPVFLRSDFIRLGLLGPGVGMDISSDGKYLVFESFEDNENSGIYQIYMVDLEQLDLIKVTNTPTNNHWPSISPGGEFIVFGRYTDINSSIADIYIVDLNNLSEFHLTKDNLNNVYPAWSPVEDWIAFRSDMDIHIISSDGKHRMNVTEGMDGEWFPAWRWVTNP
jgi:Tol biopolymer transport system component